MNDAPAPDRVLQHVLATVLGDPVVARNLLDAAVARAGRKAVLPTDPRDLVDFVRAHVVERLSEVVGPRIALAALDEVCERLGTNRSPTTRRFPSITVNAADDPASRTQARDAMILVADANAFVRASVARLLVQASRSVEVASELGAAHRRLATYAGITAVVRKADATLVARLAAEVPTTCAIVIATDVASPDLRAAFRRAPLREIVPDATPARIVVGLLLERLAQRNVINVG